MSRDFTELGEELMILGSMMIDGTTSFGALQEQASKIGLKLEFKLEKESEIEYAKVSQG